MSFSPLEMTTSRTGTDSRLIHTLLKVLTMNTGHTYSKYSTVDYIHTYRKECLSSRHRIFVRRYFQHAHFIPIVAVGKRGAY